MIFKNYTPHTINLNDGRSFPSLGIARVTAEYSDFIDDVANVCYGDIEGLPDPEDNVLYIVSNLVLSAVRNRGDVVAPATGHPDCIRKNGQIVSVPGFINYELFKEWYEK